MTVIESAFYSLLMAMVISFTVATGNLYKEYVEMRAALAIVANAQPVVWDDGVVFDCNAQYVGVSVDPFGKNVEVSCSPKKLEVTVSSPTKLLPSLTASFSPTKDVGG